MTWVPPWQGEERCCPWCEQTFAIKTPNHRFCSLECSRAFHNSKASKKNRAKPQPQEEKLCDRCKQPYTPGKQPNQRFCSDRCSKAFYKKKLKDNYQPRQDREFSTKRCPYCQTRFETNKSWQKFCSVECTERWWKQHKRQEPARIEARSEASRQRKWVETGSITYFVGCVELPLVKIGKANDTKINDG